MSDTDSRSESADERAARLRRRKRLHAQACNQVRAALALLTGSSHEDAEIVHSVNNMLLEASDTLDLLED